MLQRYNFTIVLVEKCRLDLPLLTFIILFEPYISAVLLLFFEKNNSDIELSITLCIVDN